MDKLAAIMQPTYIPWMGYFNLIYQADTFVFFDDVKLTKRSWQVRNRIIQNSAKELYLTIPTHFENKQMFLIKDAKIDDTQKWRSKHLSTIRFNYQGHKYFDQIYPIIQKILNKKDKFLVDYTIPLIIDISKILNIKTNFILSSELDYLGKKQDALISICKELKISNYLSPTGSRDYINEIEFKHHSINLKWHNYNHPVYYQKNSKIFLSHMSVLDSLFNIGADATKNLITLQNGEHKK